METKNKADLLEYITQSGKQVFKVGVDTYRVEPCPVCGHKDHFTINAAENYYKSFSNCCRGGSIIDYLMEVEGMDKAEALSKVEKLKPGPAITRLDKISSKLDKETRLLIDGSLKNITQYYYNRGLTDKTIKTYKLGYLPEGHKVGASFKYVLPVSDEFCILRSDNENDRYRNLGSPEPLNLHYLSNPSLNDVFIVEGYFDALSLEEIDRPAIALNSTSGKGKLLEALETHQDQLKDKTLIISLDNDEAGRKAADEIASRAQGLGLRYLVFNIEGYKDINAALIADKEDLQKQITEALKNAQYRGTIYEYMKEDFELDQARRLSEPDIKTGINGLDNALGGGLYPGLYILGAISSLGKTALALQLADTIAAAGHPVIFYSLEMGRYEMLCRSLTREFFKLAQDNLISTAQIIKPAAGNDIYRNPDFKEALKAYREGPAKNLFLVEGDFKTTIASIENITAGSRPVIIIDYLQVIQPQEGSRLSDKQQIDQVVVRLKQLSRKIDMPVIAVSSFNRASYNDDDGPSMAAFKESGAIEYGADVLLYMQLRKNKDDNLNEAKNKNPRQINLVILKNRRGAAFEEIRLDYFTKQNFFVEPKR